jgi:hypothetical protein
MEAGAIGLEAAPVEPEGDNDYFEFYLDFPDDAAP